MAQLPKAQKNGPIFGPAFWCRRTTPELVLGVANLGTDREMPSNATSSSLDAAGQGKRPEHTFAFNSQVETCCVYSLTNCSCNWGGPSLKGTVFDRILGLKNGPKILQLKPSFLCRVCDTWQARRCLQSSGKHSKMLAKTPAVRLWSSRRCTPGSRMLPT